MNQKDGEPRTLTSVLRRAPLSVPPLIVLITGFTHRTVVDDGFIYLRIVQSTVAGNGPVFNAGERVEAYTSPAWLAVLSVGDLLLPVRLEWLAVLLGLVLSTVGISAAMAGALRLWGVGGEARADETAVLFPAGALVFAAPFGVWVWHTSGMEGGLVIAWLGCSLLVMARWAVDRRPLGLAAQVLVGLGWLMRPELVLFSALFVLVVLAGDRRKQTPIQSVLTVAGMVAVPATYQVFRMGYFGSLVANTAIAKEGTSVYWNRGSNYLADFTGPYHLWLALALLVLGAHIPLFAGLDKRRRAVHLAFVGGGLIMGSWVVAVGGDYMHGRLLVPAFFALCAPVAAMPLRLRLRLRHAAVLMLVPWAIAAVVWLRPEQMGGLPSRGHALVAHYPGDVTTEDWGWDRSRRPTADDLGPTLHLESTPFGFNPSRAEFPVAHDLPTPALTASGIGLTSYALGPDVYVIDTLGLANPIGSRFVSNARDQGLPGHDKPMPAAWLAAIVAAPESEVQADMLGLTGSGLLPIATGDEFTAQVRDARSALGCEPLQRVQDSARGHLGPRRFLRNIIHSPANTFIRIPGDPAEAVDEHC